MEDGNLPPQLAALVTSLDEALNNAEHALSPYLNMPLKKVVASLPPIENARLNTTFAFCASSLLYSELRRHKNLRNEFSILPHAAPAMRSKYIPEHWTLNLMMILLSSLSEPSERHREKEWLNSSLLPGRS